jgi:hypothetical protein
LASSIEKTTELYTSWRNLFKGTHRLEGGKLHHMSGFCRKLENKVLRWSTLLHVFGDQYQNEVSAGAMEEAIRLSEYALGHFEHIYQSVQGSAASLLERSLRRYLSRFRGQEVRLRDIRRNLAVFAKASEETRKEAFEGLEEDGFLKRKMVKSELGGRPSPRVVVL